MVLVGGAGLIGSAVSWRLRRLRHEVLIIDNFRLHYDAVLPSGFERDVAHRMDSLLRGARIERCCVLEPGRMERLIHSFAPDCIVHLASVPLAAVVTENSEYASTIMSEGLINLLEIARRTPRLSRFVFVSSSMAYGDFTQDPMPEDGDLAPVNIYGGLKLAGEVLTRSYLKRTDVLPIIVRPSCVYGPTDLHYRVVRKFCEAAFKGEPLRLNAVNDHVMDFTHIDDAADGLVLAITHKDAGGETFNLSYGEGRPLSDIATILSHYFGKIKTDDSPIEDGDRPRRGGLDISKANRILGYKPRMPIEKGIPAYLNWLGGNRSIVNVA